MFLIYFFIKDYNIIIMKKNLCRRTKNNRKYTRRNTRRNTKRKRRNTRRRVREVKKYSLRRIRKTERSLRKNRKKYSRRKNNLLGGLLLETKGEEKINETQELHSHEDFTSVEELTNPISINYIFRDYVPVTIHYKVGEYSYLSFNKSIESVYEMWRRGERSDDSLWRSYPIDHNFAENIFGFVLDTFDPIGADHDSKSGSESHDQVILEAFSDKWYKEVVINEKTYSVVGPEGGEIVYTGGNEVKDEEFDIVDGADFINGKIMFDTKEPEFPMLTHVNYVPVKMNCSQCLGLLVESGVLDTREERGIERRIIKAPITLTFYVKPGYQKEKTLELEQSELNFTLENVVSKRNAVVVTGSEIPEKVSVGLIVVSINGDEITFENAEEKIRLFNEKSGDAIIEFRLQDPEEDYGYDHPKIGFPMEEKTLEQSELNFTLENVVSKRNAVVVTGSEIPEKVSVGLIVVSINGDEITFENAEEKIRLVNEKSGDADAIIEFRLQDPKKDYGYDHPKIGFPMEEGVYYVDDPRAFGNLLEASKQLETFSHENEDVSELLRKGSRAQKKFATDEDGWVVQTVDATSTVDEA